MLLTSSRVNPNFKEQYQQQAKFSEPSYGASISGNFLKQLIEPEVALEKIAPLAGFHPHFASLNTLYNAVQQITETSGLPVTQKTGDGIASLLGFALNSINIVLGGAGGLLAKGTVKGLSALAPDFLSNFAGKTLTTLSTETVGSLGEKALTSASVGATSLLPENIAESVTDNKLDVAHLIQATSIAGGFGLALSLAPFAAGVIRSKLFKKNASLEEATETIQKNNPDLSIDPIKNKINVPLLTPNDVKALQAVIPEELLAREGLNNLDALSRFIQKNALDRLRNNPDLSEGLKGIINELKDDKDWKPFLSKIINHLELGQEPLANTDSVKDYLKQRIENQLPAKQLTEQQISDVKEQFKHYQQKLKNEEIIDETSRSQPTFKKYQEFKTQSKVFQDLIHCLQRNV